MELGRTVLSAFEVSSARAQLSVSTSEVRCALRLPDALTFRGRIVVSPLVGVDEGGWTKTEV